MTRWIQDPLTRGAYSFEKVGTTKEHFSTLKAPIVHNSNRVWLIGEHTDTSDFSYAQGAYQSGESAAKEVLTFLSK
jgi:monoamine oxidase